MILYEKKEECCGCTACMNICPKQAIKMIPDKEGFLYPYIDDKLCIGCNLCKQVCLFNDNYNIAGNYEQPLVYAAKHLSDEVRMSSSSGGMFTAISNYILSNGGVIYGAAFDEQLRVRHKKAENIAERNELKGSKYVQSELGSTFLDIKKELQRGKLVLFTGTPCQNAGLYGYLHKNYDNLYLCDIICHGTPSPMIFDNFIRYCERKNRSRIIKYYFRYKGNGWRSSTEKAVYANGKEDSRSLLSQRFRFIFGSLLALRPACHNCKFCNLSRPSDITIADFWGIEKAMPDFEDNIGVSLVLVNSPKGMKLFQYINDQINYRESNTNDCLQPNLEKPSQPSPKREQFWRDYWDKGFEYVLKEYAGYGVINFCKILVRNGFEKTGLLPLAKKVLRRE